MSMKTNVLFGGVAAAGLGALGGFAAALLRGQGRGGQLDPHPGNAEPVPAQGEQGPQAGGRLDNPARA